MFSVSGIVERLLTGDGRRKTRLHTLRGELLDPRAVLDLPRAVLSGALRKVGYRQDLPWLGFRAVRHLLRLIQPHWTVVEFGSGLSTLTLAPRCQRLISIETDPDWFAQIAARLQARGLSQVEYALRPNDDRYAQLEEIPDRSVDLVINDGQQRHRVAAVALRKVRDGGYVFLDNSDEDHPEHVEALAILLEAAQRVWIYRDFCAFHLIVNDGLLIQTAEAPSRQAPDGGREVAL